MHLERREPQESFTPFLNPLLINLVQRTILVTTRDNTTQHEYNMTQHETTKVQHDTARVKHEATRDNTSTM